MSKLQRAAQMSETMTMRQLARAKSDYKFALWAYKNASKKWGCFLMYRPLISAADVDYKAACNDMGEPALLSMVEAMNWLESRGVTNFGGYISMPTGGK